MQRRAAAAYVALFLVVGGFASGLVVTAESPTVTFDDPEFRLSQGDTLDVNDRQYRVASMTAETSEDGSVTRSATLTWTNDSARYTETWPNNSTVAVGGEKRVIVPNTSDPDGFALRETQNRSAILQDDPDADNETVTRQGRTYVVVTANESATLVPAVEYFSAPDSTEYAEGDTFTYAGNRTTVESVSADGVRVAWTAERTTETPVSHAANVTVNGQEYFAYFPSNSTLVLESEYGVYERQSDEAAAFREHRNGLLGVGMVSVAAAVLLIGAAYLPSRY